ncbi:MAG TPA: ELWxxDGT repeat protein [Oligoflexus sp.]|uniref:ELWxxDGT repeat protein n=1 Tax=Oligoflexus sp. TaxID=1971216 RepID=UPI002D53A552|nr:ELWxxDGT repeat protein [Oligoflexus sp.]HYX37552.1 ELWxxDGT repeat protein [Oligoflexus sp.]
MKALIAISLLFILSACTKPDGKGGAEGDDAPASTDESGGSDKAKGTTPYSPSGGTTDTKNDKDVVTETGTPSTQSTSDTGATNDAGQTSGGATGNTSGGNSGNTSGNTSGTPVDTDGDGIADSADVCAGIDDSLQATRYKLTDVDSDGYADGSLSATVCPSNTEYTLTLPQVVYNDCDSSNALKWQTLAFSHRDADGDGHSIASAGTVCSGSALPTGYLTSALSTTDCDDTNPSYHTVSDHYAYNTDATTSDRYSRVSESKCVPSSGYGPINAYKEYRLAPEVVSTSGLSSITGFYPFGGKLYFRASNGTHGVELWSTDGTLNGSQMVKDIYSGASNSAPANFISAGGKLFFTALDNTGTGLWKTDGTEAGTVKVKSGITPYSMTEVSGLVYFAADDSLSGMELWKTDGTDAGTIMVKDIYPDSSGSSPASLTNVNGTLFFAADDGSHGIELWKSNGTEAGTVMVKDIDAVLQSAPSDFLAIGSTLFFTASVTSSGRELWKSDGTDAGTVLVKDIYSGGSSSQSGSGTSLFTAVNSTLYFRANDGTSGLELWKSDGTDAGTVMVKDIASSGGSTPSSLVAVNGTLYFTADNGTHGSELWKSNGTEAGTVLVKDIRSGGSIAMTSPTAVGSILYFRTDDGTHNSELWKSDGTEAGTILVKDINPTGPSSPASLIPFGNQLIFVATTPDGSRIHRTAETMP